MNRKSYLNKFVDKDNNFQAVLFKEKFSEDEIFNEKITQ